MRYSLGRLFDESALIEERQNNQIVTEAQFIQMAISSIFSKDGRSKFKKMSESINVQTSARSDLFRED